MKTTLERISSLRDTRADLLHKQQVALLGKQEAETELKKLGWDGASNVDDFVMSLKLAADEAEAAANAAIEQAEELAKEFE